MSKKSSKSRQKIVKNRSKNVKKYQKSGQKKTLVPGHAHFSEYLSIAHAIDPPKPRPKRVQKVSKKCLKIQKSAKKSSKNRQKIVKKSPKIDQKSVKNQSKISQKSIKVVKKMSKRQKSKGWRTPPSPVLALCLCMSVFMSGCLSICPYMSMYLYMSLCLYLLINDAHILMGMGGLIHSFVFMSLFWCMSACLCL